MKVREKERFVAIGSLLEQKEITKSTFLYLGRIVFTLLICFS